MGRATGQSLLKASFIVIILGFALSIAGLVMAAITWHTLRAATCAHNHEFATLRAGGQEVAATQWQAPAGGGHHVTVTLVFPATDAQGQPLLKGATTVTLTIRDLAGVPLRTFTWAVGES